MTMSFLSMENGWLYLLIATACLEAAARYIIYRWPAANQSW
jgi:hypothetical protein